MRETIQPGDVVQVVRGHVCDLGKVATVESIKTWPFWICDECNFIERGEVVAAKTGVDSNGLDLGFPLAWLKRIPPEEELKQQREEIKA